MSFNLREHKKQQRAHFKALRDGISPKQKARWDAAIIRHFQALPVYQACRALLGYMPLSGEIDVIPLLEHALEQGKRVALPYCIPGTRLIEFYLIPNLGDLNTGSYGILEPDPQRHEKLVSFEGCLCLTPGYAFDRYGYRLGFGGGYYDRFLCGPYAGGPTAGVCYGICTVKRLMRGAYDLPCDYVVTESGARKVIHKSDANALHNKKAKAPQ